MLTKISLQNFKVFDDIIFDFLDKRGNPLKYAFLYGKNGARKSSLLESTTFLSSSLTSLFTTTRIEEIILEFKNDEGSLPRGDLVKSLKMRNTIGELARKYYMVDSEEEMI